MTTSGLLELVTDITCADNVTLFGINIDFMLKFDDHVSDICRKTLFLLKSPTLAKWCRTLRGSSHSEPVEWRKGRRSEVQKFNLM